MAILVLTSSAGAPGATTLAVGLALHWPRAVLLADCDPGAHQAVLAGYLTGRSADGKGLLRVAEAHRDRRPLPEVVLDQTIDLAPGSEHPRRFLPGFARAGSAGLFAGVWPDLIAAFLELGDSGVDVIVDAGRVGPSGLPAPMLDNAAVLGMVLRTNLRAVVSARVHLTTLQEQRAAGSGAGDLGLLVVGAGRPYGSAEIGKALAVPVLATVPDDAAAAGHLSDGRTQPKHFDQTPLTRSLQTSAGSLAARLQRATELVGG